MCYSVLFGGKGGSKTRKNCVTQFMFDPIVLVYFQQIPFPRYYSKKVTIKH